MIRFFCPAKIKIRPLTKNAAETHIIRSLSHLKIELLFIVNRV